MTNHMATSEEGASRLRAQLFQEFENRFRRAPTAIVRAPGRVNLIGEHTDYNDGFVMPMAIDRATWIALASTQDPRVTLYSIEHQQTVAFELNGLYQGQASWSEYPKAVAWALTQAGYGLRGFDAVSLCEVPMGAGLSSSASFELALARAFQVVSGFAWDAAKMALLCQRAENQWVGVHCGVMDQMIAAIGLAGHALLIDCRQLVTEALPLPFGTRVVVMDTRTRRDLANSAYNECRAECERGAAHFAALTLRDVTLLKLSARGHELDPVTRRRVRHVLSENDRTLRARDAMLRGDAEALGALLDESHRSLCDDFEVSNRELDLIVGFARSAPGCLGARMTGAGFGGCALALVRVEAVPSFVDSVAQRYRDETRLCPEIYVCRAADGASVWENTTSSHGSPMSPAERSSRLAFER